MTILFYSLCDYHYTCVSVVDSWQVSIHKLHNLKFHNFHWIRIWQHREHSDMEKFNLLLTKRATENFIVFHSQLRKKSLSPGSLPRFSIDTNEKICKIVLIWLLVLQKLFFLMFWSHLYLFCELSFSVLCSFLLRILSIFLIDLYFREM